jgi:hypothetical protein
MKTLEQAIASIRDKAVRASVEASVNRWNEPLTRRDENFKPIGLIDRSGRAAEQFAESEQYQRFWSGGNWLTDEQILETLKEQLTEIFYDDKHPDASGERDGSKLSVKLRDGRTLKVTVSIS